MASNHSNESLKTVNELHDISARQKLRPAPSKHTSVGIPQRRWKLQLEKVHAWTCAVVVGQSFVLAIGLVFFCLDNFTHTPMSQELAKRGRSSPRAMSYVVTAVSTAVSALSTFLFSRAFILLLTSFSNKSISLTRFLTMSSLSRGAIFFSTVQIKATFFSIFALILLNSLTTSFTTLITPTPLVVNVTLVGNELSINSKAFNDALLNSVNEPELFLTKKDDLIGHHDLAMISAAQFLPTAAYATASSELGYPSVISYLGTTFTSSTGGILAAIPQKFERAATLLSSGMNSALSKLYSNLNFQRPTGDEPIQGHIGYTSFQSGFTVDVKCQLLPAQSNSTEMGNLYTVFEGNISLPDTTHLNLWRFHSQCPSRAPTNFTRFLRPTGSMIVSNTCKDQDFLGHDVPGSHLLLLAGKGPKYSFIKPRVCQFTPFYTIVETEYTTSIKSIKVINKDSVTNTTANAARIFYKGLILAASMYPSDSTDRLGDDVLSLLEIGRLLGHLSDPETTEDILVNRIFEKYFQGMIEAFATVIRTPPISIVKSQLNFTSNDALPPTWTSIISGNWSYQTLGWHSSADNFRSTTIAIIPILLITLSSMLLAIVSWKTLRQSSYHTDEPFDPNDLVTLLKASRDGSLGDKLSPKTPSGQIKVVEIQIELRRMPCQWELHAVNSL